MHPVYQPGMQLGQLTLLSRGPTKRHWRVRCSCGLVWTTNIYSAAYMMRRGGSPACRRCAHRRLDASSKDHPREYATWRSMKHRCHNPTNHKYRDYGGRGIRVCARWRRSFAAFLADMGERPSPTHSLDRIDNDGNYTPKNCRWATRIEQGRNTRRARMLTLDGVTRNAAAWAAALGMHRRTLHARLASGWDLRRALTTPIRPS